MACAQDKERSALERAATRAQRELLAALQAAGVAVIVQSELRGNQARAQLLAARVENERLSAWPEKQGDLEALIEATAAKYEARYPGQRFAIMPIAKTGPPQGTFYSFAFVVRPKAEETPTSRDALEEVWCAAKHALALEEHLQEMMSNAAARGDQRAALAYGQELAGVVTLRRRLMARASGQEQASGCGRCREDRRGAS